MNDTDIFDKRLIVLFVMRETNSPLSIEQVSKLCSEFDDITYIDICMYVESLKNSNYITESYQNGKIFYNQKITKDNTAIKNILKEKMDDYKQDYEVDTIIIPIKADEYKVSCFIKDGNDELINITIYAGDKENAKKISNNWKLNADNIYGKIIELMAN